MLDLTRCSSTTREILNLAERGERLMPLAPAGPLGGEGLERLRAAAAAELLGGPITSKEFADCVRSALFLYFSAIDECHTISQSISSATGSFLHGIMHRQEPDFANSKYWFRRVGRHELFPALREAAVERLRSAGGAPAERLASGIESRAEWDPFWFVDQCEAVERGREADLEQPLMEVQRVEWQLVFDYIVRQAAGEGDGSRLC